jgi:hypothetical protein
MAEDSARLARLTTRYELSDLAHGRMVKRISHFDSLYILFETTSALVTSEFMTSLASCSKYPKLFLCAGIIVAAHTGCISTTFKYKIIQQTTYIDAGSRTFAIITWRKGLEL